MNKESYKDKKSKIYLMIGIFIFVTLFIYTMFLINGLKYFELSLDEMGKFGDSFGNWTSFFTAMTFVIIAYTMHLQKKDIELQQQEIIKQNDILIKQLFNQNFFEMMKLMKSCKKEFSDTNYEKNDLGNCLNYINSFNKAIYKDINKHLEEIKNQLVNILKLDPRLNKYIKTLLVLLEMMDKVDLNNKDENIYVSILESQMSKYEKVIIVLYCIANEDNRINKLVKKYKLVNDINGNYLSHEHKILWEKWKCC